MNPIQSPNTGVSGKDFGGRKKKRDGFIESTAMDYDMDYDDVEHIHRKVDGDGTLFYENLLNISSKNGRGENIERI